MSTNVEDFPRMKESFPRILNSIFIFYPSSISVKKNQEHDVMIYILDADVFSSGTLEDESSREQSLHLFRKRIIKLYYRVARARGINSVRGGKIEAT